MQSMITFILAFYAFDKHLTLIDATTQFFAAISNCIDWVLERGVNKMAAQTFCTLADLMTTTSGWVRSTLLLHGRMWTSCCRASVDVRCDTAFVNRRRASVAIVLTCSENFYKSRFWANVDMMFGSVSSNMFWKC